MTSDLELLEQFRRGNRSAFHKLVRRHHVRLLNFFYALTGNRESAEELTRTAFLRVHAEFSDRRSAPPAERCATFLKHLLQTAYLCWVDYLNSPPRSVPFVVAPAGTPGAMTQNLPLLSPAAAQ